MPMALMSNNANGLCCLLRLSAVFTLHEFNKFFSPCRFNQLSFNRLNRLVLSIVKSFIFIRENKHLL